MRIEIDKEQIEAEWKEFCETGELPEAKPRVITMPEFLKMSREEVEKRMDEMGFGNSIEDLVETAESMGGRILRVNVTVCFLQPNSVEEFEAETIEDLTAKINEAANGREYVARGWGICTTEDLKTYFEKTDMKDISIADFDNWTIEIIGKDGNVPATTKHYVDYILLYLRCGNGLFIKRFASVLMRLFTRSLKPSQVFSSN